MSVYVLHFEPPYRHARHYVGFTPRTAEARLEDHVHGRGSPLVKAAADAGSEIKIAQVWEGASRTFERHVKNRADVPRWCPCCNRHERPMPQPEKESADARRH